MIQKIEVSRILVSTLCVCLTLDVDSVRKQAVFCHRVLRQIQAITKESTILSRESWETLLKFLLAANDSLLSPPLEKGTIDLSVRTKK